MSILREAAWHLVARGAGVLASSSVFALLAKHNSTSDAKAIFFFLFATGFLGAFLRSFCVISAQVMGTQRRSERLRRVYQLLRRYLMLSPLLAILCGGVLWFQAVPPSLAILATLTLLLAGLDCDQMRASIGRGAVFSSLYALGNGLALLTMILGSGSNVNSGAMVTLWPWIVLALANLYPLARMCRGLMRQRRRGVLRRGPWLAQLLTALYDGTLLNLPFLAGTRLADATGFDLSVAIRLFASAQPFFPLVTHWSASGKLTRLARLLGQREPLLYAVMLFLSGVLASLAFVVLFAFLGGQRINTAQCGLFVALIIAFCAYSASVRYLAHQVPPSARKWLVILLLTASILGWFVMAPLMADSAILIVAFQCICLLTMAFSTFALRQMAHKSAS